MARPDHVYINLDKGLIERVDILAASIFKHGAKVYSDRKKFITTACQKQIDYELEKNPDLQKIVKEVLV
ncbi:MAG: hypothetical protein ACPKPY_11395 [Nitrososphaeraceae archaeon]